ncbi:conserved domain protein [delta proteobacterium NaphS2]|nr:conserved domain protein [delta proteobacterium NaphS2]
MRVISFQGYHLRGSNFHSAGRLCNAGINSMVLQLFHWDFSQIQFFWH